MAIYYFVKVGEGDVSERGKGQKTISEIICIHVYTQKTRKAK